MNSSLCQSVSDKSLRCQVAAQDSLCATSEMITHWKSKPTVVAGRALGASFFRHSEDQTVVAYQAILAALDRSQLSLDTFVGWGIVAAANFFGRASIAQSFERYGTDGAWGVSPHLIPHQSLHGISGTISQALKMYGPNFGVGGGPNASADAFLLAAALLADGQVPGVWLILTGHDAEVIPVRGQVRVETPPCRAIVMALKSAAPGANLGDGLHLSIGQTESSSDEDSLGALPAFHLGALSELAHPLIRTRSRKWRLSPTHWVALEDIRQEQEAAA